VSSVRPSRRRNVALLVSSKTLKSGKVDDNCAGEGIFEDDEDSGCGRTYLTQEPVNKSI
jgi:hypothetical protein